MSLIPDIFHASDEMRKQSVRRGLTAHIMTEYTIHILLLHLTFNILFVIIYKDI